MQGILPFLIITVCFTGVLLLLFAAFSGPNSGKAATRRLETMKLRLDSGAPAIAQAQMRRILATRETRLDTYFTQFIPNPDLLRKRIKMTGRPWTLGQYALVSLIITVIVTLIAWTQGLPLFLAMLVGLLLGFGIPHMALGILITRRVAQFNAKFPDAIELLVRGLRSGLPISETMGVVGQEVPDPVGTEFRSVADAMKIGKTMDAALQQVADRLGTPEFQFFCITLAIQRETGGNLAETLANLADVLRKRSQMKLKINAMSSESKASAYIIGALPFVVFVLIMFINPDYMGQFFVDERLVVAGGIGMIWMAIGAFIMRQMINFEI